MASSSRPLRIALVVEATFAGVGRHVQDLCTELAGRSHEVHLIWSPPRADRSFLRFVAAPPPGVLLHEVSMMRSPGPNDLVALRRTRGVLKKVGPFDIVHGHSSKGGAIARLASCGLAPAVATPHAVITSDPTLSRGARAVYSTAERVLALIGSGVIAVSEEEAAELRRIGIRRSRVQVVRNGIRPLDRSLRDAARTKLGLGGDTRAVGFVGRLVPQKDPLLALRAFHAVQHRPTRLILLGEGELRPDVEAAIHDLGLAERVTMLGEAPGPEVIPALDVLLVSSRYEALPYVVLEAMSAGVPVVATRTGGVEDLLGSGAGVTLDIGDAAAIAAAVDRFLSDESLSAMAGTEGVRVSQRYSLGAMVAAIEGVYVDLAAGRPRRPTQNSMAQ